MKIVKLKPVFILIPRKADYIKMQYITIPYPALKLFLKANLLCSKVNPSVLPSVSS